MEVCHTFLLVTAVSYRLQYCISSFHQQHRFCLQRHFLMTFNRFSSSINLIAVESSSIDVSEIKNDGLSGPAERLMYKYKKQQETNDVQ